MMSQDIAKSDSLEASKDNDDFNILIFLENLKRNKKIITGFTSITFILSILYLFFKSPTYEGKFQIVLSQPKTSNKNPLAAARQSLLNNNPQLSNIIGSFDGGSIEILTELKILQSPSVLMPIFRKVKNQKRSEGLDVDKWEFTAWRKKYLKIERESKTSILNISYFDKDKIVINDVLQDISNAYQNYSTIDRTRHIKQGLEFLDKQIKIYKKEFLKSNKKVLAYAIENDLRSSELKDSRSRGLGIDLNPKYSGGDRSIYANEIRRYKEILDFFKSIKKDDEKVLSLSQIFPNKYTDSINELDREYNFLKTRYQISDINVVRNRKDRKTLVDLLKVYIEDYLYNQIKQNEFTYNSSFRPKEIIVKYNELLSQAERDNTTLKSLETEKRMLSLEKAKADNPWELITDPTIKSEPVKPDKFKVLILGLLAGFSFGYFYSFIKDLRSSKIFNIQQIKILINCKELIWLSNKRFLRWKEILNLSITKLENYPFKEDIALIKLGNIEQEKIKLLEEILGENVPNIAISTFDKVLDCKEYKNKLFIAQLSKTTKKDIKDLREDNLLLNEEKINLILFDS